MVSLLGGGRAHHATSDGPGLREAFVIWAAVALSVVAADRLFAGQPTLAGRSRRSPTPLRPLLGGYLAVIAVYGLAVADDFWIEQLQRRGTVSHGLPYVLKPGPRPAWAALRAVACIVYAVAFRVGNEPGSSTARR